METSVKRENFITILGWMVTDLRLKGTELLVYAIIYGFSQNDGQTFSGSLQYLADWTNTTRQGINKNIKSLLEKGFIKKEDVFVNGVKFCRYRTTDLTEGCTTKFTGVQQSLQGGCTTKFTGLQHSLQGCTTKFTGGVQQSLHNNIDDNIDNNIDNIYIAPNEEKEAPSRFVKPTIEEVRAYCKERQNNVDPERFVDYYTSNGWMVGKNKPMKDWRAAVRNWERNNYNNSNVQSKSSGIPQAKDYEDVNRYYE